MDATRLLEQQHKEVTDAFGKYEKAEELSQKRQLFLTIADNLSAHAAIEEKIFYPAVYVNETEDLLKEAVEEHLAAKRIIADLLELEQEDETFDPKMMVLREQIEHHIEEEEGELFPKVRKNFTKEELDGLGVEMEAMFEDLKQTDPRNEVPNEIDEAAPLA